MRSEITSDKLIKAPDAVIITEGYSRPNKPKRRMMLECGINLSNARKCSIFRRIFCFCWIDYII